MFSVCFLFGCHSDFPGSYKGIPYADKVYNAGPQTIPGKLQCEYYDIGGKGVAFHDVDSINSCQEIYL